MDFGGAGALLSGLVVGMIGLGIFLYGKKSGSAKCIFAGLALGVVPIFAHSQLVMWGVTGGCLGGLYLLSKWS